MRLVFLVLLVALSSCALTAPNGEKILLEDIKKDREKQIKQPTTFEGKPTFYKVRAYPKAIDGNIHGKHWILLQTKREKISEDDLVKSLEE